MGKSILIYLFMIIHCFYTLDNDHLENYSPNILKTLNKMQDELQERLQQTDEHGMFQIVQSMNANWLLARIFLKKFSRFYYLYVFILLCFDLVNNLVVTVCANKP